MNESQQCDSFYKRELCRAEIVQSADLGNGTGLEVCYEPGPVDFFCPPEPGSSLLPVSQNLRCSVCAMDVFEDLAEEKGVLTGTLQWGRNQLLDRIDESMLDGYDVWIVDSCGSRLAHIGRQDKHTDWAAHQVDCCEASRYSLALDRLRLPEDAVAFMIVPYKNDTFLIGGTTLSITELTTTSSTTTSRTRTSTHTSTRTETTMTHTFSESNSSTTTASTFTLTTTSVTKTTWTVSTVTSSTTYRPVSAVLRGCLGLSISNVTDPSIFTKKAAAVRVIKETIAFVCGSGVKPSYIKEVHFKPGLPCNTRRLSNRHVRRATSTSDIRADYVMVIPATRDTDQLGGAEAIANAAMLSLQTTPLSDVTEFLSSEIAKRSDTFPGIQVSVSSIGSVTLQVGINPLVIIGYDAAGGGNDEGDDTSGGNIVSQLSISFIVLSCVCCVFAMMWRFREFFNKQVPQLNQQPLAVNRALSTASTTPPAPEETPPEDKDLAVNDVLLEASNVDTESHHTESQWPELETYTNADVQPAPKFLQFTVDYPQCPVPPCCI